MNYDELLEMLDLESPSEFHFFEHFADLMECEKYITYDALYEFMSQADKAAVSEIIENYFDEISESLPDEGTEAYTFLKTMSLSLRGMLKPMLNDEEDHTAELITFTEELEKFHNWYVRDSAIECINKKDGTKKTVTFFEAIVLCRLEKLNEDEYAYGFDEGIDYAIDEYVISFGDITEDEEEGYIEEDLEADPHAEYRRGLEEDEDEF